MPTRAPRSANAMASGRPTCPHPPMTTTSKLNWSPAGDPAIVHTSATTCTAVPADSWVLTLPGLLALTQRSLSLENRGGASDAPFGTPAADVRIVVRRVRAAAGGRAVQWLIPHTR